MVTWHGCSGRHSSRGTPHREDATSENAMNPRIGSGMQQARNSRTHRKTRTAARVTERTAAETGEVVRNHGVGTRARRGIVETEAEVATPKREWTPGSTSMEGETGFRADEPTAMSGRRAKPRRIPREEVATRPGHKKECSEVERSWRGPVSQRGGDIALRNGAQVELDRWKHRSRARRLGDEPPEDLEGPSGN
jgi:hypothetical protein